MPYRGLHALKTVGAYMVFRWPICNVKGALRFYLLWHSYSLPFITTGYQIVTNIPCRPSNLLAVGGEDAYYLGAVLARPYHAEI